MILLLYIALAIFEAPVIVLETISIDHRMTCDLVRPGERNLDALALNGREAKIAFSIPYCHRLVQVNYDGTHADWVEVGWHIEVP